MSGEFPIFNVSEMSEGTDVSFELVSNHRPRLDSPCVLQSWPKMRASTRSIRPPVELYRILHQEAPATRPSSSTADCVGQPHLSVANLTAQNTPVHPRHYCPSSIPWTSVDDLLPQPAAPGGQEHSVSLRPFQSQSSLVAAPHPVSQSQSFSQNDAVRDTAFHPPQWSRTTANPMSSTALLRTKKPSSNKQIVQLFQLFLGTFGDTSSLGTQLRDSSLTDLRLSRVIDGFVASTLMKYLSAIGNFVRRCK